MLGDLIYEGKYKIANTRILNTEENKKEYNFTEEGRFKDIEITLIGTFWTVSAGKSVEYGEGQHIATTKDGIETVTFNGYGIARPKEDSKCISFNGSFFYKTSSNDRLAFLNNLVGIFEAEEDESGNGVVKVWEWK
ncbi:MAG: hypothetical protein ACPKQO_03570 [Nitrososphaeraceae archaeon]